jgi:hypothetical protein
MYVIFVYKKPNSIMIIFGIVCIVEGSREGSVVSLSAGCIGEESRRPR